jgi:hypothetical protein
VEYVHGPARLLERLPEAFSGFLSHLDLSRHVGAGEDQLPSTQQRDGSTHKYQKVDDETGDEVAADDIVKGYEVGKGTYIQLKPEELEAVAIESKRTIERMRLGSC